MTLKENEYFSISLLSAHICGFRESSFLDIINSRGNDNSNPDGASAGKQTNGCTYGGLLKLSSRDRITRGEISIIANAGEYSKSKSLTMNPQDNKNNGRVIYYNDDVRESGQLINAINIPIYGPQQYKGKNFFLELSMLELDNEENEETKALLKSLANIGGKAYPPSAPILAVLNTLGGALLSGNQDDVEARFQMRFDVPATDNSPSNISRLALAEGYYAFVREENRDLNPDWENICVNEALGELGVTSSAKGKEGKCDITYRDRTWFLVRVARENKSAALDNEYGEILGSFLKRLNEYDIADIKGTQAALDDLKEKLTTLNGKPKQP